MANSGSIHARLDQLEKDKAELAVASNQLQAQLKQVEPDVSTPAVHQVDQLQLQRQLANHHYHELLHRLLSSKLLKFWGKILVGKAKHHQYQLKIRMSSQISMSWACP